MPVSYWMLVLDGVSLILATALGATLRAWWVFLRRVKPEKGPPDSTVCRFQDGTRVIASPGSVILSVGQPGTSIAIHSPDGHLLWSGRVEKIDRGQE